ncbi:hypothetical protein C8R42DRAFT_204993 [Lentinula raphanica]|nr:hypothetical protein C8R42DRAFT_204993 [Lentinula raphanica]
MFCRTLSQSSLPRRMFFLSLAMTYLSLVASIPLPAPSNAPLSMSEQLSQPSATDPQSGQFKIVYRNYENQNWRLLESVEENPEKAKASKMLCPVSRCFGYYNGVIKTVELLRIQSRSYRTMRADIDMIVFKLNKQYLFKAFSSVATLQTALKDKGIDSMEISDPDSLIRAMMQLMQLVQKDNATPLILKGTYDGQKSIEDNLTEKRNKGLHAWSMITYGYHTGRASYGNGDRTGQWGMFNIYGGNKIHDEPNYLCYSLLDSCFGFDSDTPSEQIAPIHPAYSVAHPSPFLGDIRMSSYFHPSLIIRLNETSELLTGIVQRKNLEDVALVQLKTDLGNITKLEEATNSAIETAPSYLRAQLKFLGSKSREMIQHLDRKKPGPVVIPNPSQSLRVLIKGIALIDPSADGDAKSKKRPFDSGPEDASTRPTKKVAIAPPSTSRPSPLYNSKVRPLAPKVPANLDQRPAARVEDHGINHSPSTESSVKRLPEGPYFNLVLNQ